MEIKISKKPHESTQIVFKPEGDYPSIPDFTGAKQTVAIRYEAATTMIYCGLGKNSLAIQHIVRSAAANAVRAALDIKRTAVSLVVPVFEGNNEPLWQAVLEGACLGAYTFTKYKSDKGITLSGIELVGNALPAGDIKKVAALCESVAFARDLVNGNAHEVYPNAVAIQAKKNCCRMQSCLYGIKRKRYGKKRNGAYACRRPGFSIPAPPGCSGISWKPQVYGNNRHNRQRYYL